MKSWLCDLFCTIFFFNFFSWKFEQILSPDKMQASKSPLGLLQTFEEFLVVRIQRHSLFHVQQGGAETTWNGSRLVS